MILLSTNGKPFPCGSIFCLNDECLHLVKFINDSVSIRLVQTIKGNIPERTSPE